MPCPGVGVYLECWKTVRRASKSKQEWSQIPEGQIMEDLEAMSKR